MKGQHEEGNESRLNINAKSGVSSKKGKEIELITNN